MLVSTPLVLLFSGLALGLTPPLVVIGNKFFESNSGNQFFMKGIAYQAQRRGNIPYDRAIETPYIDNLANASACTRDLAYLQELGVNTIRVYQIDPNKNHDFCMKAFAEAGIYVIADLAEPDISIDRNNPYWDTEIFDRYKAVIEAMHKYDNVAGFLAGNEVSNSKLTASAAPFVKAAIRDVKKYIKGKGYREIPVGYASNDDAEIRNHVANYFVCSDNEATADFYGINIYEWCGYSSYQTSGYRERTSELQNFPVPVFFSEFGCNAVSPRPFTEVEALLSLPMSKVFSGGIAYEYFNYENNYGVVQETETGEVVRLTDYEYLKKRYSSISPLGIHIDISNQTSGSHSQTQCFEPTSFWSVSNKIPPTPDYNKCECLQASLSCISSPYTSSSEQDLIREICTQVDCQEIETDGATGKYGQYSDCSLKQRASYALNLFYTKNGKQADKCDFNGRAIKITNSDKKDLESIYALNGRTCLEILGKEAPSPSRDWVQTDKGSLIGVSKVLVSNFSSKRNQTMRMQSKATRLRAIPILFLNQVINYLHI